MKYVKFLAPLFFIMVVCSAFTMGKKDKGMYIAGVSASFTDSLVYFTDIQYLEGIELGKDKLLPMRDQYSDQLDSYLEMNLNLPNRTCFIYYNKNKAKLEKAIKKVRAKYQKEGKSILRETGAEFKFSPAEEY